MLRLCRGQNCRERLARLGGGHGSLCGFLTAADALSDAVSLQTCSTCDLGDLGFLSSPAPAPTLPPPPPAPPKAGDVPDVLALMQNGNWRQSDCVHAATPLHDPAGPAGAKGPAARPVACPPPKAGRIVSEVLRVQGTIPNAVLDM